MFATFNGEMVVCTFNRTMTRNDIVGWKGVPQDAFYGTLFDCEIVDNTIWVFDAVRVCGKPVNNMTLDQRCEMSRSLIKRFVNVKGSPFKIRAKSHFPLDSTSVPPGPHPACDGLILTPIYSRPGTGTQKDLFKWKPCHHITVDFRVEGTVLKLQERGNLVYFGETTRDAMNGFDNTIVECILREGVWVAVRGRSDKKLPNSRYVYDRTMINIQENINLHEIVKCSFDFN